MNNFRVWGCEKLWVSELSSRNYSNSDTTWMEQFQDNIKSHLHLTSIMRCIHQDLIRLRIFGKDLLILFFTATTALNMLILSICFPNRIYIYIHIPTHLFLYSDSQLTHVDFQDFSLHIYLIIHTYLASYSYPTELFLYIAFQMFISSTTLLWHEPRFLPTLVPNMWLNVFIRNVGEILQLFKYVSKFTKH